MYIATGQGLTTPGGQNFDVNRDLLSQRSFVTSFKQSPRSLILILYTLFHDFIHVYSPGARADNPWGRNFDVNRNILSLRSFVASLKKKSL